MTGPSICGLQQGEASRSCCHSLDGGAAQLTLAGGVGGRLSRHPAGAVFKCGTAIVLTAAEPEVLQATAAARHPVLGHIGDNLIAGVAALAQMRLVDALAGAFGLVGGIAPVLVLSPAVFRGRGVVLPLPFADCVVTMLGRLFLSASDKAARPQHLHETLPPA